MTDDERRAAAEVMAKGMVRSLYPQITDDEMHEPAKRWNGTALYDAEMSVLEDHIPEAERGILDLLAAGWHVARWRPIAEAPKSIVVNGVVRCVYILGLCPDEAINLDDCIEVIWWEPLMDGGKGRWQSNLDVPMRPTHWMPIPPPPKENAE